MLDVAISVICTNNRTALEGCMETVPAACDGLRWSLTVVDNASTDGTSDLVAGRFPWAHLVRNEQRLGFSANHNLTIRPAIARQDARFVLILNDDTRFDAGAVRALVALADGAADVGAMGPALRGTYGAEQQSLFPFPTATQIAWRHLLPAGGAPQVAPGEPGWLNGSCVLLRTAALAQIGPLDERFFIFFEDTDVGWRLLDHGWRSVVCPDAGMVHLEHQTVAQPGVGSVMARQMLRSEWLYLRKHHGRPTAAAVSAAARAALLARAGKAWARGVRDEDGRQIAPQLVQLAAYSPRTPLPHEVLARAARGLR